MADYNFQKELKKSIIGADDKINRSDLLTNIFKTYVAKMFEHVLSKGKKDRLETASMATVKRNLIDEFRNAELGEYQKSTEWYEDMFDKAMQEILEEAGRNHQGANIASIDQRLEINKRAYINESGLFIPEHLKH